MQPQCFACDGGGPSARPGRLLCPEHKAAARLADGSPLFATLAKATPPDSPLEGGMLGWLYNPVFVTDRAGAERRGWADFAAGGVAVCEDWCQADQRFDVWLLGRPDGIALLRAIGRSPQADAHARLLALWPAMPDLLAAARDMWHAAAGIRTRRESLGRWPESFSELKELLPDPARAVGAPDVDADFHRHLARLAEKHWRHVAA